MSKQHLAIGFLAIWRIQVFANTSCIQELHLNHPSAEPLEDVDPNLQTTMSKRNLIYDSLLNGEFILHPRISSKSSPRMISNGTCYLEVDRGQATSHVDAERSVTRERSRYQKAPEVDWVTRLMDDPTTRSPEAPFISYLFTLPNHLKSLSYRRLLISMSPLPPS
ncbi:hypothetical protein CEXT_314191 [Caerostris extrusa]|uniref:Pheromone biosynthesis activating neuropeptide n=1 Tax=Caerostris extrusa TaxID=172846 RepID=A0AAV4W301_CAEEX|nr:hypothetical protein CEXT_314191 [Caerostris extrusa]